MNRDGYKPMIWLMWLALPTTALNYWRVWDQLPARMAVHFDANWQPNGYTSREGSLMLALGIMTFMSLVFTIAASIVHGQKPSASGPLLIVSCLALSALWFVNNWIVERNLHSQPAHSELVGSISPATSDSASRAALKLLS
jgi:uncharacterized membrane protein